MVPGVVVPTRRAVKQGACVGRTAGAQNHVGNDEGKGQDAGTEPVRAAPILRAGGCRAWHGGWWGRGGGGEAEHPDGRELGLGKVAEHSVPHTPLVTRHGEVKRIPGATRGAAAGLTVYRAPVPRGTVEGDGVQPSRVHPKRPGIPGCGCGIPEEVADDAGQSPHQGRGGVR